MELMDNINQRNCKHLIQDIDLSSQNSDSLRKFIDRRYDCLMNEV